MSPAVINLYWNIFFVFGAVILLGGETQWQYGGIVWILFSCCTCLAGQKLGGLIRVVKVDNKQCSRRTYLNIILTGIIIVGILNPIVYLRAFGYSVTDLFNINKLLELNAEIAYDRYYEHKFSAPIISMISTIVIYTGTLIGGYSFLFMKKTFGRCLSVATLFPILFLAMITNGKVGVIACAFLWGIGWLVHMLSLKKTGKFLNKKIVIKGIIVIALGVAFLDLTMLMRIGNINRETQMIVNNKLREYAFGQIQAFAVWFSRYEGTNLDLGSNTYMFLTNWFGLTVRKQGVYDVVPGIDTNIFTQNRGIIEDFGKIGGLLYWTMIGILSGISYKKVKEGSGNCIGPKVILSGLYFMILYGFIISPWIYSSYILAFMGFAFFLMVIRKYRFGFER